MKETAAMRSSTWVRAARDSQARTLPADMGWWAVAVIGSALLYYLPGNNFAGRVLALPGSTVVAGLGLLLLAWACYRQTGLAVALTPLSFPLFMLPRHLGSREFSLGETLVVFCAVAQVVHIAQVWVADKAPPREVWRRLWPATPFTLPLALFCVAAAAATAAAHFHSVATRELRVIIVEPVLYYWLVVSLIGSMAEQGKQRAYLFLTLVSVAAAGVVISGLGILQFPLNHASLAVAINSDKALHMATSVYGSENNLGLFIDRALPILLAYVLLATRSWLARSLAGIGVVVLVTALYLTHSRGAWLVTALLCLAVAAMAYQQMRRYVVWLIALGGVGLIGLAVLARVHPSGRLSSLLAQGHGISSLARVYVWQSALTMLRDHPLFGVGPDNFLYYYSNWEFLHSAHPPLLPAHWTFYMLPAGWREPWLSHPHNIVLDFWLSTGVLGVVAMVWLLVQCMRVIARLWRAAERPDQRALALMCAASVGALVLHGLVDNSYFVIDLASVFCLTLGVLGVLAQASQRRSPI